MRSHLPAAEEFEEWVVEIDGQPWFVGKDVAERLGYANETDAMNRHCRGVVKYYPIRDSLGRVQNVRVLSEPDVMRLIVGSNLPAVVLHPTMVGGELRILDVELAARLGFARPRAIRQIIARWRTELDKLGGCSTVERVVSGNQVEEFYLNRKQAIFITGKSDTPATYPAGDARQGGPVDARAPI